MSIAGASICCFFLLRRMEKVVVDVREDGIRLINPGSCSHNRDGSPPSFGLLTFEDDGKIDLKRYNIKI